MRLDIKYLKIIIGLGFMISNPAFAHNSYDHYQDKKSKDYKYSKSQKHSQNQYKNYGRNNYKDYGYNKKINNNYYKKSNYKNKHYYKEPVKYVFIFNNRTLINYTKMSNRERKRFLNRLSFDKRVAFNEQYSDFRKKYRKRTHNRDNNSLSFSINLR